MNRVLWVAVSKIALDQRQVTALAGKAKPARMLQHMRMKGSVSEKCGMTVRQAPLVPVQPEEVRQQGEGQPPRGMHRHDVGRRRTGVSCLRGNCPLRAVAHLRAYARRNCGGQKRWQEARPPGIESGDRFGHVNTCRGWTHDGTGRETTGHWRGHGLKDLQVGTLKPCSWVMGPT